MYLPFSDPTDKNMTKFCANDLHPKEVNVTSAFVQK